MAGVALITGIGGFTGRYLAEKLGELDYEVHGITQEEPEAREKTWHAIDLRNPSALSNLVAGIKPDVVVHLAGVAFVGHGDVSDIYTSNILGTRNLLSALAATDKCPEKIVLASSANIYGNASAGLLTEQSPAAPENDYAVSKYAMELMSRQWRHCLPIVTTRPFNYTGVGQSPSFVIPKIVEHFARGDSHIELGNTDVFRDYSDVRTVVQAYSGLLSAGQSGEAYNICSGRVYSIADILARMSEIAGYEIEVKVNPAFVRENEVKRLAGCNGLLLGAIGKLEDIPLTDTLSWMYGDAVGR